MTRSVPSAFPRKAWERDEASFLHSHAKHGNEMMWWTTGITE
ncbi:hypothetical protein [Desulfonema magnum]|nr:hypothetical protein [Desulfonema magnum]